MKRDGIDRQRAIQVLRAQMPIDKKRSVADYIIHNETTPDRTEEQVKALWNMLKETAS